MFRFAISIALILFLLPAMARADRLQEESLPVRPLVHTEMRTYAGWWTLTAYSCYSEPCLMAIGTRPEVGVVGVPLEGEGALELGTIIEIEGFLSRFIVADRCHGCKGLWVDIYFERYDDEIRFGRQQREIWIVR